MSAEVRIEAESLALQRLYHWESAEPNRVAFTQPLGGGRVQTITWGQAMDQTRRMAQYLRDVGIEPGDRVALISKNTAWWLMADWAIWLAGGVSVPLYPTLAAETVRQILEHSGSKLLFIGKLDGWDGMKPGVPVTLRCVEMPLAPATGCPKWDDIVAKTAAQTASPVRGMDELATIMYTSGTTGMPKGVMHSLGSFAWSVATALRRGAVDRETRMLSYLPLSHVAERALVEFGQLATGMHVYFAESLDTFTQDLQRARPTTFFSVPRLWVKFQQGVHAKMPPDKLQRLLRIPLVRTLVRRKILKALGLDQCKYAVGGAAPMPPELLDWYARLGLPIIEGYGMTENCAVTHATLPGVRRPGTVGPPYDGVEQRIDPVSGEVQIRSRNVMLGYYREPGLTGEAFTADGWLRTGDKGSIDREGNLSITGRVKDLFKTSKGKYVSPAHIEDRLVMHGAVEACCVTGANLGQPLGILMLNPDGIAKAATPQGRSELEASLLQHLKTINDSLDPHEQLDALVLVTEPWSVDNGFVTPTLKVKRNRVEEAYAAWYEAWSASRKKVIWLER